MIIQSVRTSMRETDSMQSDPEGILEERRSANVSCCLNDDESRVWRRKERIRRNNWQYFGFSPCRVRTGLKVSHLVRR